MRDPQDYAGIWTFLRKAVWKHKFALLPHRCRISKKWIWLKKGYEGTAIYIGYTGSYPGTPVTETHWHTTGEHIKWVLTKDNHEDLSIILPIIRKTMPAMIAQDIVGVQPMTGPVGEIFKIKK